MTNQLQQLMKLLFVTTDNRPLILTPCLHKILKNHKYIAKMLFYWVNTSNQIHPLTSYSIVYSAYVVIFLNHFHTSVTKA